MSFIDLNAAERAWLIKKCCGAPVDDAPPMTAEGVLALLSKVQTTTSSAPSRDRLRRAFWRLTLDAAPAMDNPGDLKWRLTSSAARVLADTALAALTDKAPSAPSGEVDERLSDIISDAEIARVHAHANFGSMSPREVVNDGVLKYAIGYQGGHTQLCILLEHGLITKPRPGRYDANLTKKGKKYARALRLAGIALGSRTSEPEARGCIKAADLREYYDLWRETTQPEDQTAWGGFYAGSNLPRPSHPSPDETAEKLRAAKPLDWRKPTRHDRDEGGRDAAIWIAPGHGGEYAIHPDLKNFILWRIDDPYAFDTFPTVEAAKAHAEADWQKTISRKLAAPSPKGERGWTRFRPDEGPWDADADWPLTDDESRYLLTWSPCDGYHVWFRYGDCPPGAHYALLPPEPDCENALATLSPKEEGWQ